MTTIKFFTFTLIFTAYLPVEDLAVCLSFTSPTSQLKMFSCSVYNLFHVV